MSSALLADGLARGLLLGGPIVAAMVTLGGFASWWERKFSARLQNRIGPNIVGGRTGILQPVADVLKLMQKESIIPRSADKALFLLAPVLPIFLAVATVAVVPWSLDPEAHWVVADLDVGILWVLALAGLMIFPNWMAGWASNNKYTLLSAMRGVAQGVSYEIPLVLSTLVPVIAVGSLSLSEIVAWQAEHGWLVWRAYGTGAIAFVLFFLTSLAEANRIPFDIPEAESELVAGVLVEYTGMRMGIFMVAEYIHTIVAGLLAAVLFLGGAAGPGPLWLGPVWLVAKSGVLFLVIYWIRWSWYRFRADQLMHLCWTWFVPLSLVLVMGTAGMVAGGLL